MWRYLKTELSKNWKKRSVASDNFKDKYFCYAKNSKYKPEARHFAHFAKMDDLSSQKIAKALKKIVINLEKLKVYSAEERLKKKLRYKD